MNVLYNGIITDSTVLPWYLRIQWSFYYLSTTSAITVTLLFILNIEEGNNNVCLNHLPLGINVYHYIIRNFRRTLILAFQREVSARYYDMFPHGEQLYSVFKISIAKYNHFLDKYCILFQYNNISFCNHNEIVSCMFYSLGITFIFFCFSFQKPTRTAF